jgi:hypothetical protein
LSLTLLTITGTFPGDSGTMCATRSGVMVNGVDEIEPDPVCGVILNGILYASDAQNPFVYFADNDLASEPIGLHTTFQIQIDGAPLDEFSAVVPYTAAAGTIDLIALREAAL